MQESIEKMDLELIKNKRGGYRQNSGRPPKEATVTINFRVPKLHKEACKDFIRPLLKEFLTLKKI